MLSQIQLDGAEPRDAGRPSCLLQSARGEANRIRVVVHAHNMPKQGKPARLDYSSEFGLLR